MKYNIGDIVLVGDVWYEILDKRVSLNKKEYLLYSKKYWVDEIYILNVKEKDDK